MVARSRRPSAVWCWSMPVKGRPPAGSGIPRVRTLCGAIPRQRGCGGQSVSSKSGVTRWENGLWVGFEGELGLGEDGIDKGGSVLDAF